MADRDATKSPPPTPGPDDRTIITAADGEELTPSKPKYEPPYMIVVEGPRAGARFPLGDGSNIIGRAPGNAIRLEDQSVSRQHAEVLRGASGWSVKDLGSKNGTQVNGQTITDSVIIGHKDLVKTGIYHLRLITQPATIEEEMTLPADMVMADRTVFVAAPPDGLTAEVRRKELREEAQRPEDLQDGAAPLPHADKPPEEPLATKAPQNKRQLLMVAALAVVVIASAAYFGGRFFLKSRGEKSPATTEIGAEGTAAESAAEGVQMPPPPEQPALPEQANPQNIPPVGQTPAAEQPPAGQLPSQALPPPATVQTMPVFLDFASSPMSAKVTFDGNEIGQTPFRVNVELEPGRSYSAQALFVMPEIQQKYTQEVSFAPDKDKPVIPILFRGPIGILKVQNLPRDVQFYLEGKFSYDKFQEQSAKLQEIVLQKPIYVPFGSYTIELRRSRQLGQSSSTFVSDIIFKREFTIAADSPTFTLEVKDEDLGVFPAKVRSDPPNAELFVDGKMVGKTPFEGAFPLGEHKLTLRKEGYFEHSEDLKVDMNTPYAAEVKLKTSLAGAHINNARLAMNRSMYQDAVNELAEALNSSPAPTEVALANYLLGQCYLKAGDVQRAFGYFNQAKENESQRYPAILGLATAYATTNQPDQMLPLLVEVLLKATDDETKRAAHDLFMKVSPFRSIMYIYSDPPGAKVTVNDKPVAQQTPVIIHELSLGNYRIRVEKPGYLPTDLNLSLSVNEFNPVIVKLKPIPQ